MNTYILLFGITGDLSKRMLLPSLEKLLSNNMINNIYVYGVSRRDLDVNEILTTSLNKPIENISLSDKVSGIKLSDNLQDYIDFKNKLNLSNEDQLLIYLSVPPTSALQYVEFLGNAGLNGNNVKLMLEKPFGTDYASANNFLSIIAKFYREEQVYKIDHYLAKRNAQALLEFRKNNENNLRNYWNDQYIEKIEVIAAEALDIQGRGVFYEQTGALCDFIQGHLFELLLLTIIDIDKKDLFEARSICAQSLEINNINNCVRGQYLGYKEEVNNTMSYVETYAKVILSSNMNE
jgi:glucose-6-phosphate 1-dehydrogenase